MEELETECITSIKEIFFNFGENYFDEKNVTQLRHALQCAYLAEEGNSTPALITACLLHDIGHLINKNACSSIELGSDAEHEEKAVEFLAPWFGDDVLFPIRWHVPAKRYLTGTDVGYFSLLSAASIRSLDVQGGPFSRQEIIEFEQIPYFADAVKLRRWDEQAKSPSKTTPPLEHFIPYIKQSIRE